MPIMSPFSYRKEASIVYKNTTRSFLRHFVVLEIVEQTFKNSPFRIQLETILLNELIEAFNISQVRFQLMSGDGGMVQCIPIDKRPGSIFAFPTYP